MRKPKNKYFFIEHMNVLGKEEGGEHYIFREGTWEPDTGCCIMYRLMGYDPFEPEDSPYRTGSLSVMDEIVEINEKEARRVMADQTVEMLLHMWPQKFAEKKKVWDENPGWPAKLVHVSFTLYGEKFDILPEDIGLTHDCWDQGFMETVQSDMRRDLENYGAENVFCGGFID